MEKMDKESSKSSGFFITKYMLLVFIFLTIVNSCYLISKGFDRSYADKNEENDYNRTLFIITNILRMVSSIIAFIGILKEHAIVSMIYLLMTVLALFGLPYLINFRLYIISLEIQIITTYLSMGITYLLVMLKLTDGESIDRSDKSDNEEVTKDPNFDDEPISKDSESSTSSEPKRRVMLKAIALMNENIIGLSTFITVLLSVLFGLILRETTDKWDKRSLKYIGFIGEIYLRILKGLILPLIISSLIYALGNLDTKISGRIGSRAVIYYLGTTVIAIILGITLVTSIKPGNVGKRNLPLLKHKVISHSTMEDTIMDLIRNLFPENLIQAAFTQYSTKLVKPENATNETSIYDYDIQYEYGNETNILGIVVFSIVFGIIVSHVKEDNRTLLNLFKLLNIAMMILTEIVINLTPLAVLFLVLPQVLSIDKLAELFASVGSFFITVILGLFIHGIIILPLLFFVITRTNPYKFLWNMSGAIMTAFGTSSSSATMPMTFKCLEKKNHIDKRIVRFCIPVGATINMDGTALYEAVAAIFIAQYRNFDLDFIKIIIISITATAASIGAAGIPSAGSVTTIMVLNAVGLPVEDAVLVLMVDWLLDRFRTVINVLGDAFGSGIVYHLSKQDLDDSTVQVP